MVNRIIVSSAVNAIKDNRKASKSVDSVMYISGMAVSIADMANTTSKGKLVPTYYRIHDFFSLFNYITTKIMIVCFIKFVIILK